MNSVQWITTGGIPLRNENWQYHQDAVKDALKGLASMLGGNFYLSGLELTPGSGTISWTAGYVVLNGEVLYVPAGTDNNYTNLSNTYLELLQADEPSGLIVLENGNNANIFKRRTGLVKCYSSSQTITPERIGILTILSIGLESTITNKVLNTFNKYTKAQNWLEDPTPQNTVGTGVVTLNDGFNSYRITIQTGQVNGVGTFNDSGIFNDGMIITLNLEGAKPDSFYVGNTTNVRTGHDEPVIFDAGRSIQFIKSNGIWKLITQPNYIVT